MRLRHRLLTTSAVSAMIACAFMPGAHANPTDGTVTAGSATITANGKVLDITQQSDKAIIDWRGFDIDADETTNFIQPNSGSITLNRVHSSQASQINGHLNANGNIIIINQNGIVFGADAQVDVQGLVATSADVDNDRFMNDTKIHFDLPGHTNASIINNGTITARDAGLVGFVAPNVENNGTITANLGRVQLASGDTATVDFYGDGLMEVAASDNLQSQIVSNTGVINAAGGKVALTAAAGRNIVMSLINAQGTIHAQSVGTRNGQIVIGAAGANKTNKSGKSRVVVAGHLDASGLGAGQKGGAITITADDITVKNSARITASGDTGGGNIKIGGDAHGEGDTQTALMVNFERGSAVNNDAVTYGDGGSTIVWSDGYTVFDGYITGRGGSQGGNGGFVETSGRQYLAYSGFVDLSAQADYEYGTLLLDPTDITISNAADSSGSFSSGVFTPVGAASNINVTTLQTQLVAANVTINTTSAGGGNGDITIVDPMNWTLNGKGLTLTATRDILINAVLNAAPSSTNSALTLTAGRDILFAANTTALGAGGLSATAGRNLTVNAGVTVSPGAGGALSLRAAGGVITNTGILTLNGVANVSAGAFTLLNGLDAGGATRTNDLTLTTSNMTFQGANVGTVAITGFRDITLSRNMTMSNTSGIGVQAERNLTISTGVTINGGSGGTSSFRAAGAVITNTGILTLNGLLNMNTGAFTLISGLDGSGNAVDLTLSNTNFTYIGADVGAVNISGFRDITLNQAMISSASQAITSVRDLNVNANVTGSGAASITYVAGRHLTVAASKTVTSGATGALSLRAAGANINAIGTLTISGSLATGTGALTLLNGLDANGTTRTTDLTLTSSNFSQSGVVSSSTMTGFRDMTFSTNVTSGGAISFTAERNLTISTGATVSSGSASGTTIRAAGAVITNTGVLTINGTIGAGSGALVLNSGLDGSGNLIDLTLTTSNLTMLGASFSGPNITGFRDININRSMLFTGAVTITANRHLTIGAGSTVTSGAASALSLVAAGGVVTNTGIFTNNGTINIGSAALSITSGLDGSGNKTDLTFDSSSLTLQSTMANPTLSGFRDITLNRAITFNNATTITANRSLIVGASGVISSSPSASLTLNAAGGVSTNIGVLNLAGTINSGTGNVTLLSGLDLSSARTQDLTISATSLILQGATIGGISFLGFRDVTIDRDIPSTSTLVITAERNLTLNAGKTVSSGGTYTFRAAGGVYTNTGLLTINGILNPGTGSVTLTSGVDGSGNRLDLTLDNSNYTQGATIGSLVLNGYRDITINKSLTDSSSLSITAMRNLTIGSGVTLTTGGVGTLVLAAANAVISGTGVVNMNGVLALGGSGVVTLTSGLDGSGNRTDLTLTSSNYSQGATIGAPTITGFRDININTNVTSSGQLVVTAERNLTIGSGATFTSGAASNVTLKAAGGVITNTGVFTNSGTLAVGTGTLAITSGLDGSGNLADITFNTSNLTLLGATMVALSPTGFRDINLNRSMSYTGGTTIVANRHLTVGAGATISSANTALIMHAAGGVNTNLGFLTINGTVMASTNSMNFLSGVDGSGNRTDLTLTSSNFGLNGATTNLLVSGFRDLNLNTSMAFATNVSLIAFRDVTIGAGATITSGAANTLSVTAANNNAAGNGIVTINGKIVQGTNTLTLVSGLDGSGNRADLTVTSANFSGLGATVGGYSLTGFRDVNLNTNIASTGAITITAIRNLTIGAGVTVGGGTTTTLRAANNVATGTGIFTNNGTINAGSGLVALVSGLDGSGNAADLTFTSSNFTLSGASTSLSLSGFRDVNVNRNFTFGASTTIMAGRHLTIGNGVTLTATGTANLGLVAANNATTNTGALTNDGAVVIGTGNLTLLSGLDGSGNRIDLTLDTTRYSVTGGTIGSITTSGFRDTVVASSYTANGSFNLLTDRNLTINTGVTLTTGAASTVTLRAANASVNGTGVFTFNGTISVGTGTPTLTSGLDGSGNRVDLVLNGSNFVTQTASLTSLSLNGFRDLTLNRDISLTTATTFAGFRNLTIGSGVTITAPGLNLYAANNVNTDVGLFTLNGILNMGSGTLSLVSGIDGSGNRADLILNGTNFLYQGASIGSVGISGFRDVTFDRDMTATGSFVVTANRNLTLSAGRTIDMVGVPGLSLIAAGNNTANPGLLNLNGVIKMSGGNLVLSSGHDGSGGRNDLTLTNSNLIMNAATFGSVTVTGFRDLTYARNINSSLNIIATAYRDININAGVTLTSGATGGINLSASNASTAGVGVLNMNGILANGSGVLTLKSALTSGGDRVDLTLDSSNYSQIGAAIGTVSLSGFRDINVNTSITSNNTVSITADRDLTIASGVTITNGATSAMTLNAANGVLSQRGLMTLNGALNLGTGPLTMVSGLDAGGVGSADLTLDNTNFTAAGTFGSTGISILGFRDVNLNKNITATTIGIVARRNLNVGNTTTLTTTTGTMSLSSAGGATGVYDINGTGLLNINGTLVQGSGLLTLQSGTDGSGGRNDLLWNNTKFQAMGGTYGGMVVKGFRDVTIASDITNNGSATFTAERNLTVNAGVTITTPTSGGGVDLRAAGGVASNIGVLRLNGVLNVGNYTFTLMSGLDSSTGEGADITLTNSNVTLQNTTLGSVTLTGFRDVTFARDITANANIQVTAQRNITVNSGVTLTPGSGATVITLRAANNDSNAQGVLNILGTVYSGTTQINLNSGLNGAEGVDFVFDGTHVRKQGAIYGAFYVTGFRDITLAEDISTTGALVFVATRNLTVNSGVDLTPAAGATGNLMLKAANGFEDRTGVVTLNGTLHPGTSWVTIRSGLDGSGHGVDLDINSSNFDLSSTISFLIVTGFNDITFSRSLTSNLYVNAHALRDIILNPGVVLSTYNQAATNVDTYLAADRNFINNAGAGAITAGPTGRWIVYSANSYDSVAGGLPYDFRMFGCGFGGIAVSAPACGGVPATGNGFLYFGSGQSEFLHEILNSSTTLPTSVIRVSSNAGLSQSSTSQAAAGVTVATMTDSLMSFDISGAADNEQQFITGTAFVPTNNVSLTFAPELTERFKLSRSEWSF